MMTVEDDVLASDAAAGDGAAGEGAQGEGAQGEGAQSGAELSFSEGLAELEKIVRELEGNQLTLEESLAKYEKGVGLLRNLQERFAQAEQKVTVLLGEIAPESTDDIDAKLS